MKSYHKGSLQWLLFIIFNKKKEGGREICDIDNMGGADDISDSSTISDIGDFAEKDHKKRGT